MSEDIKIRTKEERMNLIFKLTQFEMQYPRFVEQRGIELVKSIIIPKIKQRMRDFNYSKKIIDAVVVSGVHVDTEGFMDIMIDNTYKTDDGFDVALAREEGTKDHFIAPIKKRALSFLLQGIGGIISSFRAFSKGHWVRGIRRSNIIEKTVEEMTPQIQARLNEETDTFLINKVRG